MATAGSQECAADQAVDPDEIEGTPGNVPLAEIEGITGGVDRDIAMQVQDLLNAAAADGLRLTGSGHRSPQRQIELRRAHCGTSDFAVFEMPSSQCSPPTARPGSSMHERGLAVDFSCDGTLIRSRRSACFQWLVANAAAFGLSNLASEPWHWSIDGT